MSRNFPSLSLSCSNRILRQASSSAEQASNRFTRLFDRVVVAHCNTIMIDQHPNNNHERARFPSGFVQLLVNAKTLVANTGN